MQKKQEVEIEEHQIDNSYFMVQDQSTLYPRFDLHQYNLQIQHNDIDIVENFGVIFAQEPIQEFEQSAHIMQSSKNSRSEWTIDQEIRFFQFLAQYQIQNPNQFRKWGSYNKKGLFKRMALSLLTKNSDQCKLKFSSFKRKHSDRKNKEIYENCMGNLIISKLKAFSTQENKFQKLVSQLQEIKTNQKYQSESMDYFYKNCNKRTNYKTNRQGKVSHFQKILYSGIKKNVKKKSKQIIKNLNKIADIQKQTKSIGENLSSSCQKRQIIQKCLM